MADTASEIEAGPEENRLEEKEDDNDNNSNSDCEEEDDEDGDEEEEYTFRFKDGENPLEFLEDNAFDGQPYKQFERLEYEALAEKKRKALVDGKGQGWEESSLAKKARIDESCRANMEEIMKSMNYGFIRRKSREPKKRGRQKGTKNKPNREVAQKLGEATLYYAHGRHEDAISLLHQIVLQAPHLADAYHTLGLVYNSMGDKDRALGFSMLAAHLMPKDSSLWKLLVSWSTEKGDTDQATYCLSKAITADPKDIQLRVHRASLYLELKDVQRAAESYVNIHQICPENVEALKRGAKLYERCGQVERSIQVLEEYLSAHPTDADLSVVEMLSSILIKTNDHNKAIQHIEHAFSACCSGKEQPLSLIAKAGICHVKMGDLQKAEVLFGVLEEKSASCNMDLVIEVADTLFDFEHHGLALKYCLMVERVDGSEMGRLDLRIAKCYLSMKDRLQAIIFFQKALEALPDHIDARLSLASLLLEENRDDEAILLLSPRIPIDTSDHCSPKSKPWWLNEKIKLKVCEIYRAKGMFEEFVNAILTPVRESLNCCETHKQKTYMRKRLKKKDLHERVKLLHSRGTDNLFQGFRPVASSSDLLKASRARKLLQKKEEEKAKALAAGMDCQSDDGSDYEPPLQERKEAPLPNILKDEEHHDLIINLCKALANLGRYSDALEIISLTLRLANSILPTEKKEQLRILGARLAYNITEPKHGFDYVKYIVQQHPYSIASWNCYYKVISRLENRDTRHYKFLQSMQGKLKDCVPPILISAHHLTMGSHHQDAARKYLEAYKLLPESPLINLCVGTAMINLALGFRLQNKHQCLAQGLSFLYNNLRLCKSSQEALYNIGRAYHHVGLVSLAVVYYEQVLAIREKDYAMPKLSDENSSSEDLMAGACDLRREAAFNLHLIYKQSGATDLARQVLRDHCSFA